MSEPENVASNPSRNSSSSAGTGIHGGDAGLQIWTRGGVPKDKLIPFGEIAAVRKDILYGSIRATIKFTNVSGTCGALFFVSTLLILSSHHKIPTT